MSSCSNHGSKRRILTKLGLTRVVRFVTDPEAPWALGGATARCLSSCDWAKRLAQIASRAEARPPRYPGSSAMGSGWRCLSAKSFKDDGIDGRERGGRDTMKCTLPRESIRQTKVRCRLGIKMLAVASTTTDRLLPVTCTGCTEAPWCPRPNTAVDADSRPRSDIPRSKAVVPIIRRVMGSKGISEIRSKRPKSLSCE
eukprot:scaffold79182_cov51-Prasinocladus_malaysianus.AAC.1